jgi:hypothetical protein
MEHLPPLFERVYPMFRLMAIAVVGVVFGWASLAQAQVYTTYYAPAAVAPVTTYYAPATTYYAPATAYYAPAPRVSYYAPAAGYYTYRPILGGWRYNPAPAVYRYPVTTAYYPAY